MKLIYATGFSKTEKLEWRPVVFNNIVQSFRMIHDAMKELDISFEKPESEVRTSSKLESTALLPGKLFCAHPPSFPSEPLLKIHGN